MVKIQLEPWCNGIRNKYVLFLDCREHSCESKTICESGISYEFIPLSLIANEISRRLRIGIGYECLKSVLDKLKNRGFIIEVLKNVNGVEYKIYTTLHAEVIWRIINGRAFPESPPWVGYFDIRINEGKLPDWTEPVEWLHAPIKGAFERLFNLDGETSRKLADVVISTLKSLGYSKLAEWQLRAIEDLLSGKYRIYVINQPTAAGKTFTFTVAVIVYVLGYKLKGYEGTKAILLYPRVSLENQQLEFFLKVIKTLNEKLREKGFSVTITLGVDKGARGKDREEEIVELKCPYCGNKGLIQRIQRDSYSITIICKHCKRSLHEFFVGVVEGKDSRDRILRQKPDILISNPWALQVRLIDLRPWLREPYQNAGIVVLDEAHVYLSPDFMYQVIPVHILSSYVVRNYDRPLLIASSATIYVQDPREFGKWLFGLEVPPEDIGVAPEIHQGRRRLMIQLTLLPFTVTHETLVQSVLMTLSLVAYSRGFKTILFTDALSELSTIHSYLRTIYIERQAVELCDHILNVSCREEAHGVVREDLFDTYSWYTLVTGTLGPGVYSTSELRRKLSSIFNFISIHHGALPRGVRTEIETQFKDPNGKVKILLSTSTLDLGIDIEDVAFIIQYKIPFSEEILEQRVGRAGRSDGVMRISTCFLITNLDPISTQFALEGVRTRYRTLPNIHSLRELLATYLTFHVLARIIGSSRASRLGMDEALRQVNSVNIRNVTSRIVECTHYKHLGGAADAHRIIDTVLSVLRVISTSPSMIVRWSGLSGRCINVLECIRGVDRLLEKIRRIVHRYIKYVKKQLPEDRQRGLMRFLREIHNVRERYLRDTLMYLFSGDTDAYKKIVGMLLEYMQNIATLIEEILNVLSSHREAIREIARRIEHIMRESSSEQAHSDQTEIVHGSLSRIRNNLIRAESILMEAIDKAFRAKSAVNECRSSIEQLQPDEALYLVVYLVLRRLRAILHIVTRRGSIERRWFSEILPAVSILLQELGIVTYPVSSRGETDKVVSRAVEL